MNYYGWEHDPRAAHGEMAFVWQETPTRLEEGLYGFLVTFLVVFTIIILCTNPRVWQNRAPTTRLPLAQERAVLTQEAEREPTWITPILQGKRELTPEIVRISK